MNKLLKLSSKCANFMTPKADNLKAEIPIKEVKLYRQKYLEHGYFYY